MGYVADTVDKAHAESNPKRQAEIPESTKYSEPTGMQEPGARKNKYLEAIFVVIALSGLIYSIFYG